MRRERKFSRKRGTITSKKEKVNSEFLGTATNCSALVIIDERVKSEDNSRLVFLPTEYYVKYENRLRKKRKIDNFNPASGK